MARTTLTKSTAAGAYATAGVVLTMTAADASNQNQFVANGNDLVIAHNTGASARTITITSVADPYGRSGSITTESIAAGAYKLFGPYSLVGWVQTDGKIYLEASHADVKFGVVTLPG